MDQPNFLQTVFSLFYAIFWGVVANAQPRWRAFNWPVAFKYPRPLRRLAVALLLLNLVPIVVFVVFFLMFAAVTLDSTQSQLPWLGELPILAGLQIFLAIVAANAPFAVHRFWIGTLERKPTRYYYRLSEEPDLLPVFEPRLDDLGKEPFSVALSEAWSRKNRAVGVAHLMVCIAAAIALECGGPWQLVVAGGVLALVIVVAAWALRVNEKAASTTSRQELLGEAFRKHDWSSVLRICAQEIEASGKHSS